MLMSSPRLWALHWSWWHQMTCNCWSVGEMGLTVCREPVGDEDQVSAFCSPFDLNEHLTRCNAWGAPLQRWLFPSLEFSLKGSQNWYIENKICDILLKMTSWLSLALILSKRTNLEKACRSEKSTRTLHLVVAQKVLKHLDQHDSQGGTF